MIKADIQFVRSLADKRVRDQERLFVAEGSKLTEEILASKFVVRRIYTTRTDLKGKNIEVVDQREMERISQLNTPSDILAVVEQPRYTLSLKDLESKLSLALDGVQNPGNMGTIIRLADWFGIDNVICSKECADIYNPKVVQATMGAVFRVRMHYVDLPSVSKMVLEKGGKVYGTFLDGRNMYSTELDAGMEKPVIIVIGNESEGISEAMGKLVSDRLYIPPYPADDSGSESLNAAVATAITVAEFRRRTY